MRLKLPSKPNPAAWRSYFRERSRAINQDRLALSSANEAAVVQSANVAAQSKFRARFGTASKFALKTAGWWALLSATVAAHESTHAVTAIATRVKTTGIDIDPDLGGHLWDPLSRFFAHVSSQTAIPDAAASNFNHALISGAPTVLQLGAGTALMTYGLRKKGPAGRLAFTAGLFSAFGAAQYALSDLVHGQGDFAMTGNYLINAMHEKMQAFPMVSEKHLVTAAGVAAITGAAVAIYKLPPLMARGVANARAAIVARRALAAQRRMQGG